MNSDRKPNRRNTRRGMSRQADPGPSQSVESDDWTNIDAAAETPEAVLDGGDSDYQLLSDITPFPWIPSADGLRVLSDGNGINVGLLTDKIVVVDSDSKLADFLYNQPDRTTRKANVRYIVRAVNGHEPLTKACRAFAAACRARGTSPDTEFVQAYDLAVAALKEIDDHP